MEPKEAIGVLISIQKKYSLDELEKEAVMKAIGVLDCVNLANKRMEGIIRARKAKRDRGMEL